MTLQSSQEAASLAVELANGDYSSLILCGSYARADFREDSDVDVVQVVEHTTKSYRKNLINYSVYTLDNLVEMARSGSLFALHVITDGKTIAGIDLIPYLCEQFVYRDNYLQLRDEMKRTASLLDVQTEFYLGRWRKIELVAKRVVRTCLYAGYAERRQPEFSMEKIARSLNDEVLRGIFLDSHAAADIGRLIALHRLIERYCHCHVHNPYRTIEAAIVNFWPYNRRVIRAGLELLSDSSESIPYEDL